MMGTSDPFMGCNQFPNSSSKAVFVDLKGRFVLVEAKDGAALDQKAITAAIVDAGYDVLKVEISTMTVDQIKAASKSAIK